MTHAATRLSMFTLCSVLLAGCGTSPPTRYHALSRPDAASAPSSGEARLLVEILPVAVPERLARSNLVINDDQGRITVMESERWLAPITDDLRQVVADSLWQTVRATDTYAAPAPTHAVALPQFRLAVRLDRFDAIPGRTATVAGSWTLRRLPNGPTLGCRWEGSQPVESQDATASTAALATASRRLADRIGDSLRRVISGQGDVCSEGR